MLSAAQGPHYDYVLNTGDNLAHKFREKYLAAGGKAGDYHSFVIKTLRFVNHMMLTSFPRTSQISALGNNDAVCGDYQATPASAMLARMVKVLSILRGYPGARKGFARGGYYMVPHPAVPRHDIIVLNSVFWSAKYQDACCAERGDPGARELAWLKKTLAQEKATGRSAMLVMHIPPGFDA